MSIRNRITSYPGPLIPVNPGPQGPPGPPGAVVLASTAPANPVNGQAWFQDTTGIFSIWSQAQQEWIVPAAETTESILTKLKGAENDPERIGAEYLPPEVVPIRATPTYATQQYGIIDPAGPNNSIRYTMKRAGSWGNYPEVSYIISGTGSAVTNISVTGGKNLFVTAGSNTTAQTVIDAVNADPVASGIMVASAEGDVSGLIGSIPNSMRDLDLGGVDAFPANLPAGTVCYDETGLYVASVDITPYATSGWEKISATAAASADAISESLLHELPEGYLGMEFRDGAGNVSFRIKTTTGYAAVLWWDGTVTMHGSGAPLSNIAPSKEVASTGSWRQSAPKPVVIWSCVSATSAVRSGDVYNISMPAGDGISSPQRVTGGTSVNILTASYWGTAYLPLWPNCVEVLFDWNMDKIKALPQWPNLTIADCWGAMPLVKSLPQWPKIQSLAITGACPLLKSIPPYSTLLTLDINGTQLPLIDSLPLLPEIEYATIAYLNLSSAAVDAWFNGMANLPGGPPYDTSFFAYEVAAPTSASAAARNTLINDFGWTISFDYEE
jgi:hypothetical protein